MITFENFAKLDWSWK